MYIPQYFKLQEFFPRDFISRIYPVLGNTMWRLIDNRLLWTADMLRNRYGTVIANDWEWGGSNQYRGFRPFDCVVGAEFSQHKYGRALDCKFGKVSVDNVRQEIVQSEYGEILEFKYITAVEMNVSWLHISVENNDVQKHGIKLIYP